MAKHWHLTTDPDPFKPDWKARGGPIRKKAEAEKLAAGVRKHMARPVYVQRCEDAACLPQLAAR
jgi:hypothetical protein